MNFKGLLKIILSLIFVLGITLTPISSALAWELDQSNQSTAVANININPRDFAGQSFIPTMPTLNWIEIYAGDGGDNWLSTQLVRVSTGTVVATGGTRIANDWAWYSVIGEATVAPGETYLLKASCSNDIYWKVGQAGYLNGDAYYSPPHSDRDFWFKTYGTPGASPTPTPSPSPSPTSSTPSGEIGAPPSENIDYTIKPATDLKADDETSGDDVKIKLTWEKSETEDVDGYRVFSKKDEEEYGMIGETSSEIAELEDTSAEKDVEYTYMVRAYRDDAESEDSNEIKITPGQSIKSLIPLSFDQTLWKSWEFWSLVALGVALIAVIIWYIIDRRKRRKNMEPIKSMGGEKTPSP